MSPSLMEGNQIDPWVLLIKTVLDMPCPQPLSSTTEDSQMIVQMNKHIFWKVKGVAAKIAYRMFVKYGDPSIVENKQRIKDFS
jgi:hypothetical protein